MKRNLFMGLLGLLPAAPALVEAIKEQPPAMTFPYQQYPVGDWQTRSVTGGSISFQSLRISG